MRSLGGYDRYRCARTCRALRAAFDQYRWTTLVLSAQRLVCRGRYSRLPHWSEDACAIHALLASEKMRTLRKLRLRIDTPFFDYAGTAHDVPEARFATVAHLVVEVTRRHYASLASASFPWLFGAFAHVHTLTLNGLRIGSKSAACAVLCAMPCVRTLTMLGCTLAAGARPFVTMLLAYGQVGDASWSPELAYATLDVHGLGSVVEVMRQESTPLCLPKLEYLHVTSASITPFLLDYHYYATLVQSVQTLALPRANFYVHTYGAALFAMAERHGCAVVLM